LLVALIVVTALVAVGVIAVSATAIRSQRRDAADREALAAALADGDLAAVEGLVASRPGLFDTDDRLDAGTDDEVELNARGYGIVAVDLDGDREYVLGLDDDVEAILVTPDGSAERARSGLFVTDDGEHRLALVGEPDTAVELALHGVAERELDVYGDPVEGEITFPGEVVDHPFTVSAGQHYIVEAPDGHGLESSLTDLDGNVVETYVDDYGDTRFVAEETADLRLRIEATTSDAVGPYEAHVWEVAWYSASYGDEGDAAFLDLAVEPGVIRPQWDPARRSLSFCVWVREDIELELTVQGDNPARGWELFSYDEAGEQDDFVHHPDILRSTLRFSRTGADFTKCFDLVPDEFGSGSASVTLSGNPV